jgi:hypothetical protein
MTDKKNETLRLVDLQGMNCVFLDDKVLIYHTLYFKTDTDEGFYAYSELEEDIIELRNKLIKNKFFNALELTTFKLKNIPAILKHKREKVECLIK